MQIGNPSILSYDMMRMDQEFTNAIFHLNYYGKYLWRTGFKRTEFGGLVFMFIFYPQWKRQGYHKLANTKRSIEFQP